MVFHHVRPDDGLIEKGRNMKSPLDTLHHNKMLCLTYPPDIFLVFDITFTHNGDEPLKDYPKLQLLDNFYHGSIRSIFARIDLDISSM